MLTSECSGVHRRDIVCGGGAALFSSIVATLLGDASPARAATITGKVPEVDRVAVRVVVDNYQFATAPSRKLANIAVEHFGWPLNGDRPPGKTLISEFGLSMHVETHRATETRNVLIDFGFTPGATVNNTNLLGIDPGTLDALVLSHGHYDHFGGLAGFLTENRRRLKPNLPIYIGGEEAFCSREWMAPPAPANYGVLDRNALKDANLTVTFAEGPALIADHGFTTGHIDQSGFEKVLSNTAMKIGVEHGIGCFADQLPADERTKALVPDQFRHEIATAYNLKGRGLVIVTSCSHRGVMNTIRQAQAASGVNKVHAVIGGLHLAPYADDYVRESVAALKSMDIDYIIPLHCSGEAFYELARAEMPEKLLRSYTGTRFVFA